MEPKCGHKIATPSCNHNCNLPKYWWKILEVEIAVRLKWTFKKSVSDFLILTWFISCSNYLLHWTNNAVYDEKYECLHCIAKVTHVQILSKGQLKFINLFLFKINCW